MNAIRISVNQPEHLLVVIPHRLGFHPRRSVAVVAFTGRRVEGIGRVDLPEPDAVGEAVRALGDPFVRVGARSVMLVGYEDEAGEATDLLRQLERHVTAAGVDVLEVLTVRGDRWCSPRTGHNGRIPRLSDVPELAGLVAMERVPLASREELARLVEPDPQACSGVPEAIARIAANRPRRAVRRAPGLWRTLLDVSDGATPVEDLTPAQVARLASSLAEVGWRDGIVAWTCPDVLPLALLDPAVAAVLLRELPNRPLLDPVGEVAAGERLLVRLLALARRVPDDCPASAAAVCTLVGCAAWAAGDGAIAGDATERALRLAPDYRLARLVSALVANGVAPPGSTAGGSAELPAGGPVGGIASHRRRSRRAG